MTRQVRSESILALNERRSHFPRELVAYLLNRGEQYGGRLIAED
jgi:hypothetical protein